MAKRLPRPAPPVTSGQGDSDLARPSRTPDAEIDALLDEAGVGVEATDPEISTEPKSPDETPAARPGAPTPEAPVTGAKGALANLKPDEAPALTVEPTAPAAPASPADPKAPAAPAEPTAPKAPTPPVKIADPEVDGLKEPVGASTEALNNFKKLREIATQRKTEFTKLKTEFEDAVAYISKIEKQRGQLPEDVQKELTEHREFRRRFDIRNDQEFKTKYDTKVEENSAELMEMLKKGGMPEEAVNRLKGTVDKQSMKWWQESVIKPLMDSENFEDNKLGVAIEAKVKDNMRLAIEKEEAITNASKEGSQWQKERETQVTKQRDEENTVMRTTLEELQKTVPWGRLQQIPPDAAPEDKARIERENAMYKRAEELMPVLLNPANPTQRMEAAALGILSFWQRDEMDRMADESTKLITAIKTENDSLKAENAKLKSAGKTNKAGAAAPVGPPKTVNSIENAHLKSEVAVEKLMSEMNI